MKRCVSLSTVIIGLLAATGYCADWPQWHGPNRNAMSSETGLLKQWPEGGPKLLWSVTGLGKGFSSIAVADGLVYTTGAGEGDKGFLVVHDLNGKFKWKLDYGAEWTGGYPGVRSTPTVDGDRVYLMTGAGTIVCIDTKTRKTKWAVNAVKKFKAKMIRWGIAESLLIDGDKVICTPGGPHGSVVAMNKMTGKTVWMTPGLGEPSAYCSPILITKDNRRLIVTMTSKSVVGIDPETGKVIWRHPFPAKKPINPNTPVYRDGLIYVTSGYGTGSQLIKLSEKGAGVTQVWTDKTLDCHHGGVVLIDGYLYGTTHKGKWVCLELASGKTMYQAKGVGKGSVMSADGMIYCYSEEGIVGLIKPSSKSCQVVSTFKVTKGDGQHWAHPVISDGRLYIRHGDALMAYDIKAKVKVKAKVKAE